MLEGRLPFWPDTGKSPVEESASSRVSNGCSGRVAERLIIHLKRPKTIGAYAVEAHRVYSLMRVRVDHNIVTLQVGK